MSILSVDTIQPIGSGSTVTLNAAKIVVGTGITFESNGQAIYAGIITATSFVGGLPITNGADNRVITASSASALNGEANLTFDGNDLSVTGTAPAINFIDTDSDDYKIHNVQGVLKITDTTASADRFVINDNGTGYF